MLNYLYNIQSLEFTDIEQEIIKCCADLTKSYDETHDVNHHIAVYHNAIKIITELNIDCYDNYLDIYELMMYASLLHDTIDYKYKLNLENNIKKLDEFLMAKVPKKFTEIKWIIDNISYSKEVKSGYPIYLSNNLVQIARDIVSDADKLEAIGEFGIKRCTEFVTIFNPLITNKNEIMALVVEHCHEKLLKLKDDFIHTIPGKKMAEPGHQFMIEYISQQNLKID